MCRSIPMKQIKHVLGPVSISTPYPCFVGGGGRGKGKAYPLPLPLTPSKQGGWVRGRGKG